MLTLLAVLQPGGYLEVASRGAVARPAVRSSRSSDVSMGAPGGRRVVVTGMGILSCLGNTLDDVRRSPAARVRAAAIAVIALVLFVTVRSRRGGFGASRNQAPPLCPLTAAHARLQVSTSLKEAKSGIKFNPKYKEIGMKSHVCGRPEIELDDLIDRKQARFMGINAKYAFVAMQRCIEDAGLSPEDIDNPRVGGILGQGGTSLTDVMETMQAVDDGKLRRIGPYRVTRSMGSTVSAVLSTHFKLKGMSFSISSACSTGAHCIGVGMEQIQLNKADMMFCGAGEAEDWGFSVMFDSMTALSTK